MFKWILFIMIKLVELGSIHKSKDGIFEMTSNNGGAYGNITFKGEFD